MELKEIDLRTSLKKYFGFSKFIGLQEDVIKNVTKANNTFVIMPTGGGKSLCYQLPALIKEEPAPPVIKTLLPEIAIAVAYYTCSRLGLLILAMSWLDSP